MESDEVRKQAGQSIKSLSTQQGAHEARILFVDAYDSFSNNIVALLREVLSATVKVIRIDTDEYLDCDHAAFVQLLKQFDGVVIGPGPGHPKLERDVGVIKRFWSLPDEHLLPILGICLGFQSLCCAFGASIETLEEPRHGIVSEILHKGKSLFEGVKDVSATNYHSLHVNIGHRIQLSRYVSDPSDLWKATEKCPALEPLAWDFDNLTNGAVLMGVRHLEKPFWGVQYHPESICTNGEGAKVVKNWWKESRLWFEQRGSWRGAERSLNIAENSSTANSSVETTQAPVSEQRNGQDDYGGVSGHYASEESVERAAGIFDSLLGDLSPEPDWTSLRLWDLSVADVCQIVKVPLGEAIVLESRQTNSERTARAGTANFSIIGCIDSGATPRIYHFGERNLLEIRKGRDTISFSEEIPDVWQFISRVMEKYKIASQKLETPFWGGFMGFASYEAGLRNVGVCPPPIQDALARPEICFAWISRSIVIDHGAKRLYVQSIRANDSAWILNTATKIACGLNDAKTDIRLIFNPLVMGENTNPRPTKSFQGRFHDGTSGGLAEDCLRQAQTKIPFQDDYHRKVRKCHEEIWRGNSYELCLTSQTEIRLPATPPESCMSWQLYERLRMLNPAPFQVYMRLGNLHLLSSSPERFLSWDRRRLCQYRPIKGTVKKRPGLRRSEAEAILSSAKERAENLMIVDLIRHDLRGVIEDSEVTVTKLMGVEEYASVYQLVSVVEGRFGEQQSGVAVLRASLPPGSMTGAPKRRSCEILKRIEENKPRGIYSGVIGYLDVGGGGDFSVVIRTAYRWETESKDHAIWHIGAGGAVTAQSNEAGEFEEMLVKLESIARVFDPDAKVGK